MQTASKKVINGWAMYDWANSVYSLTIVSTIFPIYFYSITTVNGNDVVPFFGLHFKNTALYSYSLSFSFLILLATFLERYLRLAKVSFLRLRLSVKSFFIDLTLSFINLFKLNQLI